MRSSTAKLRQAYLKRTGVSVGEPSRAAHMGAVRKRARRAAAEPRGERATPAPPAEVAEETAPVTTPVHREEAGGQPAAAPEVVEVSSGGRSEGAPPVETVTASVEVPPTDLGVSLGEGSVRPEPGVAPEAAPADAGPSRVGRVYNPGWQVREGDSGLSSRTVARELVRGILLPTDVNIWGEPEIGHVLNEAYFGVIRYAHEVALLHDGIRQFRRQVREKEAEMREAVAAVEARAVAAEAARDAANAARDQTEERSQELAREVERHQVRIAELESLVRGGTVRLGDLARELSSAQSGLEGCQVRCAGLESDLVRAQQSAKEAAQQAREAEARNAALVADLGRAKEDGVTEYLSSDRHGTEVDECTLDGFLRGFDDFRRQAIQKFPELDWSGFEPDFAAAEAEEAESGGTLEIVGDSAEGDTVSTAAPTQQRDPSPGRSEGEGLTVDGA